MSKVSYFDWIDRGFFTPSVHVGTGPGDPHWCSRSDAYFLAVCRKAVESGFNRKVLAEHISQKVISDRTPLDEIRYIALLKDEDQTRAVVIPKYGDYRVVDFNQAVSEADLNGFDTVFLIDFQRIKRKIDKRIDVVLEKREQEVKWILARRTGVPIDQL
jgi:hypothetical protein